MWSFAPSLLCLTSSSSFLLLACLLVAYLERASASKRSDAAGVWWSFGPSVQPFSPLIFPSYLLLLPSPSSCLIACWKPGALERSEAERGRCGSFFYSLVNGCVDVGWVDGWLGGFLDERLEDHRSHCVCRFLALQFFSDLGLLRQRHSSFWAPNCDMMIFVCRACSEVICCTDL